MVDYHCDKCGADASYDPKFSGCGDPSCCTPQWDLVCGCEGALLCSCDEQEKHAPEERAVQDLK